MKVRCISTEPTREQAEQLGPYFRSGVTKYPVDIGVEYLALGVGSWDGIAWVELAMPTEVVVSVPLFLFEITDPRPSALWEVRIHKDGALTLWPRAFYEEFFHDRLSDGDPEMVAALRHIQRAMWKEMESG